MKRFTESAAAYREHAGTDADTAGTCAGRAGVDTEVSPTTVLSIAAARDLMWRNVGLFRHRDTLQQAVAALEGPWSAITAHIRARRPLDVDGWKAANLLTVARLIARAALRREESRGAHYRDDYPERDDIDWKRRIADRASPTPE